MPAPARPRQPRIERHSRSSDEQADTPHSRRERIAARLVRHPALLTFAAALLLGWLRRPEQLLRPVPVIEEGAIYMARALAEGPRSIFAPYEGAPRLLPRLIGYVESLVDPLIAPAVGSLLALLVIASIATLIASHRLAHLIPSTGTRVALGLLVVLLPGADEQHGLMVDIERYLPIGLFALLYARPLTHRLARLGERAAVVVALGSGATAVVMAPLYLLAAWRPDPHHDRHERRFRLGAMVFGCVAVLLAMAVDPRGGVPVEPGIALAGTAVHAVVAVLGAPVAVAIEQVAGRSGLVIVGAGLLVAAGYGLRLLPRRLAVDLVVVSVVVLSAGLLSMDRVAAPIWDDPRVAQRYAFLLGPLLLPLLVLLHRRLRGGRVHLLGVLAGAVAIAGLVAGFRLYPFPDQGYRAAAPCLGGPHPCTVPAHPAQVWSIEWPGSGQPYHEPHPGSATP